MRRLPFYPLILAAIGALALAGCSSKPTLVGDWTGSIAHMGMAVSMDFSFSSDGNLTLKQSAGPGSSTVKGPYKELEKTFTFTPTSMESPVLDKATLKALNDEMAKTKQTVTFNLKWKDADTVSVAQQGAQPPLDKPVELKRKK